MEIATKSVGECRLEISLLFGAKIPGICRRQTDGNPSGPDMKFMARGLFIQSAISAALFIIMFTMFRLDNPLAKRGQQLVTTALTENMDFDSAEKWYKQVFSGAPSFIPMFGSEEPKSAKLAEGEMELQLVTPLTGGSVVQVIRRNVKRSRNCWAIGRIRISS